MLGGIMVQPLLFPLPNGFIEGQLEDAQGKT